MKFVQRKRAMVASDRYFEANGHEDEVKKISHGRWRAAD
jgi:hypothetical protein